MLVKNGDKYGKYGKLPTLQSIDNGLLLCALEGWFTEAGTQITEDTIVNLSTNQTLHARWSCH